VLSTAEIVAVLHALEDTRSIHPGYSDAALLLLLTGVRREMVRGMTRRELDDLDGREPRWIVPGGFEGRSKSGRAHVVPLSRQALRIVRRPRSLGAFPRRVPLPRCAEWQPRPRARCAHGVVFPFRPRSSRSGFDAWCTRGPEAWHHLNAAHTLPGTACRYRACYFI
jgi:integrase